MNIEARYRAMAHTRRLRLYGVVAWGIVLWLFLVIVFSLPTVAFGAPHYSQAYTRAAIRTEARAGGYDTTQTRALVHLGYHESRWHNWSHSRYNFHGVFQLSRGMAHGHPWSDPRWNTRRAIRYIRARYGTPVKALSFFHRRSWY